MTPEQEMESAARMTGITLRVVGAIIAILVILYIVVVVYGIAVRS